MTPWYLFPPDGAICLATHDVDGWMLQAHPATHPSNGAPCQVFDVPDTTLDRQGCSLLITNATGQDLYRLHGVLYLALPTGAGLVVDVYPKPPQTVGVLPRLVTQGPFLAQDVS